MKLTFDTPHPGDIGWMISAHGRNYAKEFAFDLNFEIDIARKVISFLEKNDSFKMLFIARSGDCRAGSIAISTLDNKTAFINFLLVEQEFRKKGIAGKLLEKVIHHTDNSQRNCIRLETYSCLRDARKLYEQFGFSIYKVNKNITLYGHVFDQEFWEKKL